jgi:alpha-ketoglutarate-dependent taurine dioxygenase
MSALTMNKLTENVGVEITGLDADRLLKDETLPGEILAALEENGVVVFPKLTLDRETQLAVCHRLGDVDMNQGIMVVSLDESKTPTADLFHGTFEWHMDGVTLPEGQNPQMATLITAVTVAEKGGQTEFASTYGGYESLTPEEKERCGQLRVFHTVEAILRRVTPDPTPEQEAAWARSKGREHPMVWRHRSGRRSLVVGANADHVVGMDRAAGQKLLDELLERATAPERVYRHEWSVGDTVLWDNRGVLHRVEPYADDSGREMIRTTFLGDEPIE